MLIAETKRYFIRHVEESDFEDIKVLLKSNRYLGMLWSVDLMSADKLDEFVKRRYMNSDDYCVIDKNTGSFGGHISLLKNEREGEFSVRMQDDFDVQEIMSLFGEVLKINAPATHKNLTIQYSFE